ncbi:MAG TPA: PAS domain-containing protein [Longimicrobiales bacterium]|nr:PAS domain-containing protein [Longimicrobiales bacterium]
MKTTDDVPIRDPDGDLLRALIELSTIQYLEVAPAGGILRTNDSFARHVGIAAADLEGRSVADFLTESDGPQVLDWASGGALPSDATCLLNVVTSAHNPRTLRCVLQRRSDRLIILGEAESGEAHDATARLLLVNNEFATLTRELARKSRALENANEQLVRTLKDLETSYWHLQKIQEVLPVCMSCGQVKSGGSRWEPVIDYLRTNDIFVSHGYCPPCHERLVNELEEEDSI